jgi:predicted ATPase
LAQRFHTLVLDDVPLLSFENRNEAKRFIILIDTLYENRVKLVVSAAMPSRICFTRPIMVARRSNSTARPRV